MYNGLVSCFMTRCVVISLFADTSCCTKMVIIHWQTVFCSNYLATKMTSDVYRISPKGPINRNH